MLIFVTDDQRSSGTMAVMPRTRQWFASRGTSFSQAYVTTPLCCPSRASIFTGRYAHSHGVLKNRSIAALDHDSTIQHYLDQSGYQTAIAGKYLNHWALQEAPPDFDHFGILNKGYAGARFNLDGTVQAVDDYSTDYISDLSTDFLRRFEARDDQPWFLYVAPTAAHPPFVPEAAYADARVPPWRKNPALFEPAVRDKPDVVFERKLGPDIPDRLKRAGNLLDRGRTIRRLQLQTLMSVDDLVGRVAATLKELDEERDTLAFFLSDNGYLWGEHRTISKRLPYTPSVKVPFMVRWPGRVPVGRVSDRPTLNIDIAPTILDVAGIDAPRPVMEGRTLFSNTKRKLLFFEQFGSLESSFPSWYSIRTKRFQYVQYELGDGSHRRLAEYYDLSKDPWQLTNLLGNRRSSDDPSKRHLDALEALIDELSTCGGESCP